MSMADTRSKVGHNKKKQIRGANVEYHDSMSELQDLSKE